MEKKNKNLDIKNKLEYIGLDLENIPETLKMQEPLEFKPNVGVDEKKYKQYRFVSPKELEILLSPTNRLEDIKEKYSKAAPLMDYLDSKNEENEKKYETFLKMLEEVKIEDIDNIEESQQHINKKMPLRVRYQGNYLWQIYYSEKSEKYFMIVPTEDKDYSTFFYVLKKKIEKKKAGKIFVPICNADYTANLLNKTEIQSLENYLWTFTNDWPAIYEVFDKTDKGSIQIVGETEIYKKIKSQYKVKLASIAEANQFFKLVKALFILQTELPAYYKFETGIDKYGSLEFYYENELLNFEKLSDWVNNEYKRLLERQKEISKQKYQAEDKLSKLKRQSKELEEEYLSKEKQISTFLECKKTFFGKVKYFFKYSGKKSKVKKEIFEDEDEIIKCDKENITEELKNQYTLEEIVEKGKIVHQEETEYKNIKMDTNAIKLKNLNLVKKIENATSYIVEIESHKKSIFEFWKYTNKDQVKELKEAEEEKIEIKPHMKNFDFDEDFEDFGNTMDKIQREIFNKEELDNLYLLTTDQIEVINRVKTDSVLQKELETYMKRIKKELKDDETISEDEVTDIFGSLSEDTRKINEISNKTHREQPKNKFSILQVSKSLKTVEYKSRIINAIQVINTALDKNKLQKNLSGYKWIPEEQNIDTNEFNIFNLNAENEIEDAIRKSKTGKINLYKMNFKKGISAIAFTNCVYYNNQNKTLPEGMDLDTKILAQILDTDITLENKKVIRVGLFEDESDDQTKLIIKKINLLEYDVKELEE